jgi:16S rRNA (guanine527-N7)-methyltransferase
MDHARIAKLLRPFLEPPLHHSEQTFCYPEQNSGAEQPVLSEVQLQSISTYMDTLLRWNARINLTAIRDHDEIITRHFGESLFAARYLFPTPDAGGQRPIAKNNLLDIGSGAGFPGIPIKIWAPHIHLTLVESSQKKATFLREVCRSITLMDVDVLSKRAEDLAPDRADIITLRAVERFDSVLPTAVRLARSSGRIGLLIGKEQEHRATALGPEIHWRPGVPIPLSSNRIVMIGERDRSAESN